MLSPAPSQKPKWSRLRNAGCFGLIYDALSNDTFRVCSCIPPLVVGGTLSIRAIFPNAATSRPICVETGQQRIARVSDVIGSRRLNGRKNGTRLTELPPGYARNRPCPTGHTLRLPARTSGPTPYEASRAGGSSPSQESWETIEVSCTEKRPARCALSTTTVRCN